MSVKKVMRAGNRVPFDEEGTYIEDKVTGEKIRATDDGGMFMVKMWVNRKAGFRGRRKSWRKHRIHKTDAIEVDKPEEEDAFKSDDEEPRPEDRSAGEEEGEQAGREDEGEEGRRAKGVSDKEREEHELTHTPFRALCTCCVRARGRNTSHLENQGINQDKSNDVQHHPQE